MSKYYVESAPEKPFGVRAIVMARTARLAATEAIRITTERKGRAVPEDIIYISQLGFMSDRHMPEFETKREEDAWFERYRDDLVLEVADAPQTNQRRGTPFVLN